MDVVSTETEIQAYLANSCLVFSRSTVARTPRYVLEGGRLDEMSAEGLGCQGLRGVSVHWFKSPRALPLG